VRNVLAVAVLLAASAATSSPQPGPVPEAGERRGRPRDPLVPPAALYAGQDLPPLHVTLIGVDRQHPGRPMAVLRLDSRPPVRRVVRPGERIGEYRVLRIDPDRVQVIAPSFGGSTVLDLAVRDSSHHQR
jgi:hypothetical protein